MQAANLATTNMQADNLATTTIARECKLRHGHKHNIKAIATWATHKNSRILLHIAGPISVLRTQKSMFSILHGARQGQAGKQAD